MVIHVRGGLYLSMEGLPSACEFFPFENEPFLPKTEKVLLSLKTREGAKREGQILYQVFPSDNTAKHWPAYQRKNV